VRKAAASALGTPGNSRAVEPLIEALNDPDPDVAGWSAAALGRIGDKRAVEPLIKALQRRHGWSSSYIADALGDLGDPRAIEPLVAAYNEVNDRAVTRALASIHTKETIAPLINALRSEDMKVREPAVNGLKAFGADAVELLINSLKDENAQFKCAVIDVLGEIGDERAIDPLIKALKDQDADVVWSAVYALADIGDERAVKAIEPLMSDTRDSVRGAAFSAVDQLRHQLS
jgi:HEAT repeat protein